MVRINNLNEAVASLEKRTTTLERRPVGGNGVSIYVGPDYRGTGPAIQVPRVPNPPVTPDNIFNPRPIPDLIIWVRRDDNKYYQYNPVTNTYENPSPIITQREFTGPAVNGWIYADEKFQNLRTGQQHDRIYGMGTGYENFFYFDGQYYYTSSGSLIMGEKKSYRYNLNHHGNGSNYPKYNFVNTNGWRLVLFLNGITTYIGAPVPSDVAKRYKLDDRFTYKSVNKEGNILVMPDGENKTYLLSGHDGRELGQYERRVTILGGMLYLDTAAKAVLKRDFTFLRYMSTDNYYTPRWAGEHVAAVVNYQGQYELINIDDGSYNCVVPTSGVIIDVTI